MKRLNIDEETWITYFIDLFAYVEGELFLQKDPHIKVTNLKNDEVASPGNRWRNSAQRDVLVKRFYTFDPLLRLFVQKISRKHEGERNIGDMKHVSHYIIW